MLQVPCSQTEARSGERSIFTGDPRGPPIPPLPPSTPLTLPEMLGKEARTQSQGNPALGAGVPGLVLGGERRGSGSRPGGGGGKAGEGLSPCECGVLP